MVPFGNPSQDAGPDWRRKAAEFGVVGADRPRGAGPSSSDHSVHVNCDSPGLLTGRVVAIAIAAIVTGNLLLSQIVPNIVRATMLEAAEQINVEIAAAFKRSERDGAPAESGSLFAARFRDTKISIRRFGPEDELPPLAITARTLFAAKPEATLSQVQSEDGTAVYRTVVADSVDPSSGSPTPDGIVMVTRRVDGIFASATRHANGLLIAFGALSTIAVAFLLAAFARTRSRWRGRQAMMRRLETAAYTDSMTGLLNRGRFMELGEQMIECHSDCRLYLIDVDHFKEVNDEFGHATGDTVIRETARRLRFATGEDGLIARLGGDEFVILRPLAREDEAMTIGEALIAAFDKPFAYEGGQLCLSASVGMADNAVSLGDLDQMMLDADVALYRAKEAGRNRLVSFNMAMNDERVRRRQIEKLLARALGADGFEYRFQPMFETGGGQLTAFEMLLRLRGANGDYIPPGEFIPIAEDMRLMTEIGERVMREAVSTAALMPKTISIGLNVSPRQFGVRDARGRLLEETLADILAEAGVTADRVVLEVTQGSFTGENAMVIDQLNALKAMGVRIALDDFGSGSSDLSCLWEFGFDSLKISQTLARGLKTNVMALSEIVRSIVNMSHTLGLRVIAEGVETEEEAAFFREAGCDNLQGFLLGRPMRFEEMAAVIATDTLRRQLLDRGMAARDQGGETRSLSGAA